MDDVEVKKGYIYIYKASFFKVVFRVQRRTHVAILKGAFTEVKKKKE